MRVSNLVAVMLAGALFAVSVVHADEAVSADAVGESAAIVDTEGDDRMVCKYEKRVGSHMKKRVCKTVAERNREREEAVDAMNKRSVCGNCKQG